jgi:hypothetical protein
MLLCGPAIFGNHIVELPLSHGLLFLLMGLLTLFAFSG